MRGSKSSSSVQMPQAFVPFISHPGDYQVTVDKDGGIHMVPKAPGPQGNGTSNGHGKGLQTAHSADAGAKIDKARLRYAVADKRLTPARAETFGMSKTRLKVYRVIYKHKTGLLARDLMKQTGLPHGSIQQTLNWLRGHKLVAAKELSA